MAWICLPKAEATGLWREQRPQEHRRVRRRRQRSAIWVAAFPACTASLEFVSA